jgi:hypothetical protein
VSAVKRQKTWVYSPPKAPKPQVPPSVKAEVTAKANELVEKVLKPERIKIPPEEPEFNYIVDIKTKWHHSYFYFVATYNCPGPTALSPCFDVEFTRLEYVGGARFNLAYKRYTGRWQEVEQGLTLDENLATIEQDTLFWP